MKRVERSTDHNPPPIFIKLDTKLESREMWLPIVFGGNLKDALVSAKPEVELIFIIAPMEK